MSASAKRSLLIVLMMISRLNQVSADNNSNNFYRIFPRNNHPFWQWTDAHKSHILQQFPYIFHTSFNTFHTSSNTFHISSNIKVMKITNPFKLKWDLSGSTEMEADGCTLEPLRLNQIDLIDHKTVNWKSFRRWDRLTRCRLVSGFYLTSSPAVKMIHSFWNTSHLTCLENVAEDTLKFIESQTQV